MIAIDLNCTHYVGCCWKDLLNQNYAEPEMARAHLTVYCFAQVSFSRMETLEEILVNEHKGFANLFVVSFEKNSRQIGNVRLIKCFRF